MSFAEMFEEGGVMIWPILVCGIFGVSVTLERLFYVFLRASVHSEAFMTRVQRHVLDGNIDAAVRLCSSEPTALLPRVLKAGLLHAHRTEDEMTKAVEEATRANTPLLGARIPYLPMIANAATLLGLLGTIQGLILSFDAVAAASAETRSSELSHGIAVAMYTTFLGLMVAIPVLVSHGVISARANRTLDDIDHYGLKLVNLLVAVRSREPSRRDGAPLVPAQG
ncbi:MAG: MotA/TolQ/ExbB proton channel family protein [Pseudomonadota bacterium]|nr:MotA/TolQ/ExbB proton channel family protein [Pseudomonadota bacterium]